MVEPDADPAVEVIVNPVRVAAKALPPIHIVPPVRSICGRAVQPEAGVQAVRQHQSRALPDHEQSEERPARRVSDKLPLAEQHRTEERDGVHNQVHPLFVIPRRQLCTAQNPVGQIIDPSVVGVVRPRPRSQTALRRISRSGR